MNNNQAAPASKLSASSQADMQGIIRVIRKEPNTDRPMDVDFSFALPSKDFVDAESSFSFTLPERPIEVVQKYKDWCVLSVSRGNGPRVVEEWVRQNEAACFEQSEKDVNDVTEGNTESNDDTSKPTPILANPHNAACAHSLLLVPRHPSLMKSLTHLHVIAHCLVKGYHPPGTEIHLSNTLERKVCATKAVCLEVVPSNSVGHVSLLAVSNDTKITSHIAPRQFRRHLLASGWPVLGAARDCYAFRGEKLCLSTVGLEFEAHGIDKRQSIVIPPVPKLRKIMEKEERFWRQRQGVDGLRIELFGDEVPKPVEYIKEKASFDNIEFRCTKDVMIPRPGSVALVDIVEQHMNSRKREGTGPWILDLGTGCGNLLLSILKRLCHLDGRGIGMDAYREALQVCDYNINALGLSEYATTVQCRFSEIKDFRCPNAFDVVVCNPPYIPNKGSKRNLDVATTYEPEKALFVDRERLNIHYEDVLYGLTSGDLLQAGALLVFEVCKENANAVCDLMSKHNFEDPVVGRDCKNCIRTVHGTYLGPLPRNSLE